MLEDAREVERILVAHLTRGLAFRARRTPVRFRSFHRRHLRVYQLGFHNLRGSILMMIMQVSR